MCVLAQRDPIGKSSASAPRGSRDRMWASSRLERAAFRETPRRPAVLSIRGPLSQDLVVRTSAHRRAWRADPRRPAQENGHSRIHSRHDELVAPRPSRRGSRWLPPFASRPSFSPPGDLRVMSHVTLRQRELGIRIVTRAAGPLVRLVAREGAASGIGVALGGWAVRPIPVDAPPVVRVSAGILAAASLAVWRQ